MIIPKFGMFCVSNFLPQRNFTDTYNQERSNIANKTIYNKFNERLQAKVYLFNQVYVKIILIIYTFSMRVRNVDSSVQLR